jgi:hypothetical protein
MVAAVHRVEVIPMTNAAVVSVERCRRLKINPLSRNTRCRRIHETHAIRRVVSSGLVSGRLGISRNIYHQKNSQRYEGHPWPQGQSVEPRPSALLVICVGGNLQPVTNLLFITRRYPRAESAKLLFNTMHWDSEFGHEYWAYLHDSSSNRLAADYL